MSDQQGPIPGGDLTRHLERMARFPNMNPGPVVCAKTDGTIVMANPAARRVFGREDLEGACLWDLLPAIDESARAQCVVGSGPVRLDAPFGDIWLGLTLTPDPDGGEIFMYGTDITKQKAAERDVAERARFPELNPGPVARLERNGSVIRANPAAAEVFGRPTLVGASWRALCEGLDDATWERVFESETNVTHEETIGDRTFSFTLRYEPTLDQVFVYGSDVTEIRVAQRALAELARFPELNPGPVCRLDRSGTILLANPAALAVFGVDDLTGRSWLDLCPGLGPELWERILRMETPLPIEAEINRRYYVMTHAPGPEGVFVFVYGSDITHEKQAEAGLRQSEKMATLGTLAAGVAHELNNPASAAARASEQLESAFEELERLHVALQTADLPEGAEGLLAELAERARAGPESVEVLGLLERSDLEAEVEEWLDRAGVEGAWEVASHLVDLGYDRAAVEALAERTGSRSAGLVATWLAQASHVHGLLKEIRQSASRLSEIVGAMKAYSYLGQAPVQDVDVNEGLRNTLVILRSKLKKGVRVSEELDPDLPLIEAHGGDLNQAWTNLIDNAVQAMEGEGSLALRSYVSDGHVVIEIEDDGPGIPPEIQGRIYDAFFTTRPPGQGTGLGLNTTYNIIVKKHGGSIDCESAPGRTRFRVTLPIRTGGEEEMT